MRETNIEVKHITDIVGEWGKWQFQMSAHVFIFSATFALLNMGFRFHAKSVPFWCSDVPEEDLKINNLTEQFRCSKYSNPEEVCTEWTYNTTQFKRSIITEFDLVCDRSYYGSLTQTFFMLGFLVSGLVLSNLSDKYGRRPIVWFAYIIIIMGTISCALSINIYQYLISRFLVGIGSSTLDWTLTIILMEICGPKYRSDIVTYSCCGWVLGCVLLPGLAFWLQDFRYMQLITAIPLVLNLFWFWFLWESPRWQITNGKADKAEQTIRRALKMKGKSVENLTELMRQLTDNLMKEKENENDNDHAQINNKSNKYLSLIKTPNIRKYSFIFWYSWVINALLYYGISFNMSDFGGNSYISFLLSGLVELPGQILIPLYLKFIGRRSLYVTFMIITTLSILAVIPSNTNWLKVMFALIAKYAITSSSIVMAIHIFEVYPTVLRHTAYGMAAVFGRIGSLSAPFMGNLAMHTSLTFVMILYAILTTIGGLLALLLPETRNRELPDTIEETEHFEKIQMKRLDKVKDSPQT